MRVRKFAPVSRVFCYCSVCKQQKPDHVSYAIVDSVFRCICKECLKSGLFKFEEVT